MSTKTTTKPKTKTAPKTKRKRAASTTQQRLLAAMANAKGKPAAKITGPNIAKVQRATGGDPATFLNVSPRTLASLAMGTKTIVDLPPETTQAIRKLSAKLGSDTYYGRKLGAMLWAVQQGAEQQAAK